MKIFWLQLLVVAWQRTLRNFHGNKVYGPLSRPISSCSIDIMR